MTGTAVVPSDQVVVVMNGPQLAGRVVPAVQKSVA